MIEVNQDRLVRAWSVLLTSVAQRKGFNVTITIIPKEEEGNGKEKRTGNNAI